MATPATGRIGGVSEGPDNVVLGLIRRGSRDVRAPAKPRGLRFYLTALVLASTVPLLAYAAIMTFLFERQQRAAFNE